ncbi:lytic transglycosylase domain-containing protein [Microbacterium sp. NPDC057407]|uniref:aggregation-promoting factor C-terminal-like domain-containing protein n=1 Tax=Microbacterium sp. NPDC057407 TaxID=3346120 RepID=UPI00367109F1
MTIATASLAVGLLATGAAVSSPVSFAEASAPAGGFALASFTTPNEPVAVVQEDGTDDISTAARDALDGADTVIAAAADVTADVKASGLDLGDAPTTVDTSALGAAAERLSGGLDLPAPLVPDLTDDVTALITAVKADVADLRASLAAAKQKKAEAEAAAKAKREAEARAAAEAAAAAEAEASAGAAAGGGAAPAPVPAAPAVGGGPGEAQAIAQGMLASYGWGGDQFSCLVALWNKESGWNYAAYNASSGAYGIPQALPGSKMATAGADWQTNPATQISWGLGYIAGRYGSPCGAWSHSQSVGWY